MDTFLCLESFLVKCWMIDWLILPKSMRRLDPWPSSGTSWTTMHCLQNTC